MTDRGRNGSGNGVIVEVDGGEWGKETDRGGNRAREGVEQNTICRVCKEDKSPIQFGRGPVRELYGINRVCKQDRWQIEDGRGPERGLFAVYMLLSEDKRPILDGMVPEKKLYAINRVCKEDKRPIEDGRGPVSE